MLLHFLPIESTFFLNHQVRKVTRRVHPKLYLSGAVQRVSVHTVTHQPHMKRGWLDVGEDVVVSIFHIQSVAKGMTGAHT